MKILIIGSKGFIGSHALDFFKSKNYSVKSCDIINDYVDENYYQIDATNADYHSIFQNHSFDFCINCSGAASVPLSLENPLKDFNLNTNNVFKILDAIRNYQPLCKFVNLSSAAVYGNPKKLPIKESDPTEPLSPYGFHKKFSEDILKEFYNLYSTKSVSLRIFSAYGNGLKKQLLWDICQKAKSNQDIQLFGTGHETRDFVHTEDIMQAIDLVMQKAEFVSEVYNLANGQQISIKQIASMVLRELNFNGDLSFSGNNRVGDPLNWVADISKLKALGYESKMSIEEGVRKYVSWAKELE